ncbi:MAG: tRNA (adenosine(37)-N6)-threonylcarbamoyltransferase complex ATPase subunit type 1 TsaE [Candidatus Levybacteria bacterium]|nr:tRNA (adenosine(37)-N6)-threonylcarbamoyltransferase complex ATPase subunit type 1 TsaE [Candidatus Levybacteria bacterium]
MKSKISENFGQTQRLGKELAKTLKGGSAVCLYGQLGAGKTTFVQGLAKGLGIKQRITSPTFIIVRKYKISKSSVKSFYHIDLYRIDTSSDIKNLGLDEILNDKNALVVIEWAEKFGSELPKKRIDIYFENIGKDERKITWSK